MRIARWCGLFTALVVGLSSAGAALPEGEAAELYHQYCSVCHGDKGDGQSRARNGLNPPPRDFTAPGVAESLPRERMIHGVLNGVPGTAMVGWAGRISEAQAAAVVDYIRTQFMRAAATAEAHATAAPTQRVFNVRGQQIYQSDCSVCHGDKGDGQSRARAGLNPPPRDFTSPVGREVLTEPYMVSIVTNGKAGTAMPGFGKRYSAADIAAVVAYVREAFLHEAPAETVDGSLRLGLIPRDQMDYPAADMNLPMPQGLVGNVGRGAFFYNANCFTCHGVEGAGNGPRAYFIFPKPRNFVSDEARATLNRPNLFNAVKYGVRGREMPGWAQVLSDQDIADVAEYVYQMFIKGGMSGG